MSVLYFNILVADPTTWQLLRKFDDHVVGNRRGVRIRVDEDSDKTKRRLNALESDKRCA